MSDECGDDAPYWIVIALTVGVMSTMFIGPITIDLIGEPAEGALLALQVISAFGTAISLVVYWVLVAPFILAFVLDWHRRRVADGWDPSAAYLLVPLAAVLSIPMEPLPGSGEAMLFTPGGGAVYLHRRAVHLGTPGFAAPGVVGGLERILRGPR